MRDKKEPVYIQRTCEGCLAVCLLRIVEKPSTAKLEIDILTNGFPLFRDSYALAISAGFHKLTGRRVTVTASDPFYYAALTKNVGPLAKLGIELKHEPIRRYLQKQNPPFALYVDSHVFSGTYEHSPHFICVIDREADQFKVLDPSTGIAKTVSLASLLSAARSLPRRLGYATLAIEVERSGSPISRKPTLSV